jgi:hypothetical protein
MECIGIPREAMVDWTVLLSMLSAIQFRIQLSDRQATLKSSLPAEWLASLHLPQVQPAIRAAMLCRFRQQLHVSTAGQIAFQQLLHYLNQAGFLASCPRLSAGEIETQEVMTAVCLINRVESVVEAMETGLEALAVQNPEWLRLVALPHWYSCHARRIKVNHRPVPYEKLAEMARQVGSDIYYLVSACEESGKPEIESNPEVFRLKRVLREQFELLEEGHAPSPRLRWRQESGCVFYDESTRAFTSARPCYENWLFQGGIECVPKATKNGEFHPHPEPLRRSS